MKNKVIKITIGSDYTNGDVIMSCFPKAKVFVNETRRTVHLRLPGHITYITYELDWWLKRYTDKSVEIDKTETKNIDIHDNTRESRLEIPIVFIKYIIIMLTSFSTTLMIFELWKILESLL